MADRINSNNPLLDQLGIQKKQEANKADQNGLMQQDFLKLMIAQIQNQSPLKPQENGEFLGQLAQFSTVEGLQDMQKTLDTLSSSIVSNQALQASSMVGRFVRVPGNEAVLPGGEGERFFGAVELEQTAANLKFEILSPSGEIVKTIGVGNHPPGVVNFAWDGTNNKGEMMPEGKYNFRAVANIGSETQSLDTHTIALVESVTLGRNGEQMKLNIAGLGERTMDAVREILS